LKDIKGEKSLIFMSYRFLDHATGVKFRADGEDMREMFVSAAGAFNEAVRGDIKILELNEKSFEIEGESFENLLYGFLEKLLVLLNEEDFLVADVKSFVTDGKVLKCVVVGDKAENYKFSSDIKMVCYNDVLVKEIDSGFECLVVLGV
jgi:SHS2 domain-containing protein